MRFCSRPYQHIYITRNGKSTCCSWARFSMGNIVEEGLEKVWNGDKAKELRNSIEDGSFRYCDAISCPLISNNLLPDLTEEQFKEKITQLKESYPTEFNLAYDYVCNHVCPTCRDEIFVPSKEYKMVMDKIDNDILPYLNKAKLIMASGNGDFFSSQSMMKLFSQIKPENKSCIIKLETNGALVEKNWDSLKHLEHQTIQIVVTPNSYEKETYKELSGGLDNLEKTLSGIKFLSKLRQEEKIKELKITMVVQNTNFREIPSFIKKNLEEFNVDVIQLRPVMKWFGISEETYLKKNILNPLHPNHEEFINIINSPICKHPKVFHWCGDNLIRESKEIKEN